MRPRLRLGALPKPLNMRFLYLLLPIVLLLSSCESDDDPILTVEPDITFGSTGLELTTAYARYTTIDAPDGSFVSVTVLGDGATVNTSGQTIDLPSDLVRFTVRVPNTEGDLVDGTYPVIRSLPMSDLYASTGGVEVNHDGSFNSFNEMEGGSITIAINGDRIQVTFAEVTTSNIITNSGAGFNLNGSTELDLVLLE